VVASDVSVLREVGGTAVEFCKVGDVEGWLQRVAMLLRERQESPLTWNARRERGREHARRFTWERFAGDVAQVYRDVARDSGIGADPVEKRWRAHA